MKEKKKKVFDPNKVGIGRLFAWHSRTLSAGVVSIIIAYLSFYCTDVLGMSAALVGSILMASKLCDGVSDLFAGWLVDNTNTRWGKARPYEFCIIGVWLSTFCLFATPVSWGTMGKSVWIFIMYTLLWSVFQTMLNASETPYVIRAFGTKLAVVKVASYGGVIVTLGCMVVSMVFPILVDMMGTSAEGWRRMMLMFAVPLGALGMLRFLLVKEDRIEYIEQSADSEIKDEKVSIKDIFTMLRKNKYMWLFAIAVAMPKMVGGFSAYTYYFNVIVGSMSKYSIISLSSLVMIVFMFLVPVLMKKFSGIELFALSSVVGIIGYIINFAAGSNMALLFIGAIGTGVSCMPYSYLKSPLIMQISDYNARNGMQRMEGTIGSVINFVEKVFQALGSFVFGILLSVSGYDGTLKVQPDSAVAMIKYSYSLIPIIFMIVVIVCSMKFRPLDKLAEKKEK